MAGEIMTAYIALAPSMRGFGAAAAQQIGPQARQVGTRAGQQAGQAFTQAASKESAGWFSGNSSGAMRNIALFGAMSVAVVGVQRGLSAALDSMVGFNAEIEQATVGFTTLLGSTGAAEEQMQWIKDFAKETPFQYKDLVGYSQQLLALGFNAEETKDVLQASGDAAAALGRGSDSIARVNLALGQMWTKGKVQSQEMLQLTEAGIGGWQILAEAYGTSVEKVQDSVTKGLVKATDAVPLLIAGMNKKFGGLMEQQSHTYAGVVSNIQDTLQQQLAEAGEPLFEALKVQAERFLKALDDPAAMDMMREFGSTLADGVEMLAKAAKLAWDFRDALIAIGIAVAATKLLSKVPSGSMLSADMWFSATRAQSAYQAGLSKTTALQAGLTSKGAGALKGIGSIAGIMGVVDGYQRVSEAGESAAQTALGFAESMGAGAVAGLAFGGPIGAAAGAVVGLTTSLWSYSQAAQAANKDTTAAQQAFQNLGLDANIASAALSGVTNSQLAAAGGVGTLQEALKSGTFDEYVADLQSQAAALKEQAGAEEDAAAAIIASTQAKQGLFDVNGDLATSNKELITGTGDLVAANWRNFTAELDQKESRDELLAQAAELDALLGALADNSEVYAAAQDQVTASNYQAAYAADIQTGALGRSTQAAWDAVVAAGGLSDEALNATIRMEGLAGVAGYATQMISGIPSGTPINFSTNAADIVAHIITLIAALHAATSGIESSTIATVIAVEKVKLAAALNTPVTVATLPTSAPKATKAGGGHAGKSGKSAADLAKEAAEKAAAKLKKDRDAQKQFGDAFGALMASALEGDWEQYRDQLADQIEWLTDNGYKQAAAKLKEQSKALTKAAKDYAALTNKLEAAQGAYDDLTAAMTQQYEASRDQILGLGQITDAQSFDQLAYLMGQTTSAALQYQDVLQQLKDQGLSQELWDQLAQAGPESMGLAQSILAQGQTGIDQLNSLSTGLVNAADSMGSLVSDSMYGQGVKAMEAYIKGLESQSKALEAQLETIANNVLTKTAGAITPGNAGYSKIDTGPQQVVNTFGDISIDVSKLRDLEDVAAFIKMLNEQPTTQLVNQAGTVTS